MWLWSKAWKWTSNHNVKHQSENVINDFSVRLIDIAQEWTLAFTL